MYEQQQQQQQQQKRTPAGGNSGAVPHSILETFYGHLCVGCLWGIECVVDVVPKKADVLHHSTVQ